MKMGEMETKGRKSNKQKQTNARKDRQTDRQTGRQTERERDWFGFD